MIDPRTVMIACPCYDGRMMAETAGSIVSCGGLFAALSTPSECSHPSLVRDVIADSFLRSPFEWLVCLDNDIAFTRADFMALMQPTDPNVKYFGEKGAAPNAPPVPTRIKDEDGNEYDVLVNAEYAFKTEPFEPVKFGMGFARIHRSVFETLKELRDDEGRSRIWQTQFKGRLLYDFFPSGPIIAQIVATADWKGEDHGFWTMCMLAGLIVRIETRTRLTHIGRKAYPYLGPDEGGGQ